MMRWTLLLLLLVPALVACNRETLTRIEYGPPVAVRADLADKSIAAGGETTVACVLEAEPGFQVLDPQTYRTYVEPVDGLDLDGFTVGGVVPGYFEVYCGFEGMSESIEKRSDRLTVHPANAYRIEIQVEPDRSYFAINDSVSLRAVVRDPFDNPVIGLADDLIWSLPDTGIVDVNRLQSRVGFKFVADGEYPFSVSLGAPYDLSSPVLVLVCDTAPPVLVVTSPERGESLDDPAITVSGHVSDETSGVSSLLINGVAVTVSTDGSFSTELEPVHGLNHIRVVASDEAGRISEVQTSVYHSAAWRLLGDDSFDQAMPDGLGVHLSQGLIDSGDRSCGFAGDSYACEAYADMATFAEVVLNSMDLGALAAGPVYEYGPILLTEENLGSQAIDTPGVSFLGIDPYRIHGSFVLRGDYTISANIVSVERGKVELGDGDRGLLGLQSVDGGLNLLAYVRPEGDRESGIAILLEIRIDVDVRVFFTVDKAYDSANGVWNLSTGADVTDGACDDFGAFELIDMALNLLGYSSNFRGYVCLEEPLVHSTPNAHTSSTVSFERAKIAGKLLFDTTEDGNVEVTLVAHPDEFLIDFLGESVAVDSDEEIIIDLSSVEVVGGWLTVDLGQYSIGSPLELLDPILTTLLTELQLLLSFVLEDLIVCENSISGCPLDIAGLIEELFNSLAARDLELVWPSVMPSGSEMQVMLSQYFSSISFGTSGGRMGFDTAMTTQRRLDAAISEPRGTLLRGGCVGDGALAAVPSDRFMAAGFDLDLVNQALLMGWYNGGLSGPLDSVFGGGAVSSLSAVLEPLLPPVMTACAGVSGELELHLGAARLDLTMVISGVEVRALVFSDLVLPVEPMAESGSLGFVAAGAPRLNELELLSTGVRLGSHEQRIKQAIGAELMPDLLTRFGETVLAGIPVPTINIAGASWPGLDFEIEVEFPLSEADHRDAVVVVVSD